jgi:hypothetical protein
MDLSIFIEGRSVSKWNEHIIAISGLPGPTG